MQCSHSIEISVLNLLTVYFKCNVKVVGHQFYEINIVCFHVHTCHVLVMLAVGKSHII